MLPIPIVPADTRLARLQELPASPWPEVSDRIPCNGHPARSTHERKWFPCLSAS
jgi:hypothetical protein